MNATNLELWSEAIEPLPPRSRLFSLEMIGVGTPRQEALSSYLVRLANSHSVTPKDLVNKEIFPLTSVPRHSTAGNFSAVYSKTINGIGKYAAEFSSALGQLTRRTELAFGTCLPWRDVLDAKAVGLLHPHPRWCPACFAERRVASLEPYLALAWFITPIAHCAVHQKLLVDRCPHCDRHQPFIPKHQYLDHCSHCRLSLAVVARERNPKGDMHPVSISSFYSAGFAEMIAEGPRCEGYATRGHFVEQTKRLAQVLGDGNLAEMHRKLGLRDRAAEAWVREGCRPAVLSLLSLCHRVGITPVNFLRDEIPHDLKLGGKRYAPPSLSHKRVLSKAEKTRIEQFLRLTLEDTSPSMSIKQVGEHLGYPPTFLRYWWRELVLAIGQKHKKAVNIRSLQRVAKLKLRIEEISREIFDANPNAPLKRVSERIVLEHLTLEWPAVRQIIREVRATYLNPVQRTG